MLKLIFQCLWFYFLINYLRIQKRKLVTTKCEENSRGVDAWCRSFFTRGIYFKDFSQCAIKLSSSVADSYPESCPCWPPLLRLSPSIAFPLLTVSAPPLTAPASLISASWLAPNPSSLSSLEVSLLSSVSLSSVSLSATPKQWNLFTRWMG